MLFGQDAINYAAKMLDAMPPWPQIWWHGKDGKACPCEMCCYAAEQIVQESKLAFAKGRVEIAQR